ncbi:MAG: hypothetical protein VR65_19800 [Desulfobulbaceae bacterium BRH_c16a]|nr:MAG: hypothetical protein VR65_19800 [Desulfobulbaceae bacterium BRH_c16a]
MTLDPTSFSPASVVDTCSVWNVLSSRKLYHAAFSTGLSFCITPMVLYECLHKPRSTETPQQKKLKNRLLKALDQQKFPVQKCELEDLVAVIQQAPSKLGSGELSCIAAAYRIRSIAFMTDEKKARKFATNQLGLPIETTPKLYAWLHFYRHLADGDHGDVIREHENFESRCPLTKFFTQAYEEAQRCRLMQPTGK